VISGWAATRVSSSVPDLKVWQRSHASVLAVYRDSRRFPADERFGLTSQVRRVAASVPTNIAEGSKRRSNPDHARFLNVAEGSLAVRSTC
jgi:four helix bundle protein